MTESYDSEVIKASVTDSLGNLGFEFHPFKIGWYNKCVKTVFHLNYSYDTLAFLAVSTPQMFEKAFLPFVKDCTVSGARDPIDECMMFYLSRIRKIFPDLNINIIHDFELYPNRRPKVLMQTASHISGAAYYYQRDDLKTDPWNENKRIYGVCVHPKYGGWFALRGIAIFEDILCPNLRKKEPIDVIPDDKTRIELLEKYNYHWEDWTFRDIIPVIEKYSEKQRLYFNTKPKERLELLHELKLISD